MACFLMTKILVLSCSVVSLVVAATASHRPTGLLPSCTDDESYRSSLGLSCFQHRHLDCNGLSQLGLINHQELKRLLASCPASCKTPSCSEEHTRLIGEDNKAAGKRTRHNDTENKVSELLPADRKVHRRDQSSCYPNWPPACQDDASYTNKIGLGCPQMIVFSCDEMHKIGFSEQETYDLINACPCSCGIMCGTWTGPPTEKPITAPSITSTFSPTTVPTAGPSPMVMDPNAFTPTTTPTTANVFLPSNTPTIQPSSTVEQTKKSSSTTTVFVPQGLEQLPETSITAKDSAGISDTLTTSLFFVAGAVMSLLVLAAYYHYTKKRKQAPELVEEAGDPNFLQSPDAKDDNGESKKSEQASSIGEAGRFLVICDDEYDSKNNGGDEGLEIADTSLPRPTSPAKLDKMLQEGSLQSNDITVQEASLGASTIYTNDQASLRFEDDYIGEVESYSKATCTTFDTRETEDDDMSGKTPQISNSHKIASFWRRKRLAQVAKAQDAATSAATEESKTMEELQDLQNENIEARMEVEEEEESIATKVISHRSNERTAIGGEKSDSSTVIIAENGCNALGNCISASRGGTKASEELLDVDGIEAEVKQAKDDLKNEMNQLRKDLGLNVAENKEFSGEDAPTLDEQSTFTDSLWTRDTKESTITRGSFQRFDQEINEAKDFLSRGASDFIGFLASPTLGCARDFTEDGDKMERCGNEEPEKDDASHREGFTAYTFSPLQAKRSTQPPTVKTAQSENHTIGDTSKDIEVEVTNKPMALHTSYTKTRTGHSARVVKGIHGALPHGTPRQAQTKDNTDAALNTIVGDMDDDKSDAYTCTPMTRDTTCVEESQDKATANDVDPVHSAWNRWKTCNTPKESFDESSWDATTCADDTVMHETRAGRGSDESASYTAGRSIQESGTGSRSVGTVRKASVPTTKPAIKTVVRKSATRSVTLPTNVGTVSNGVVAVKRQKAVHKGLEKKQKVGIGTGRLKRSKK